ncbi:MAG: NnrU family protein [Rhizobiales bacterium]|nr:NnrU family protein [Hyphomicrobiales bacterium]
MSILIAGMVLFFSTHFARVFFPDLRENLIKRFGVMGWRGLYSIVSLAGLGLIIWGFGEARQAPNVVWVPPFAFLHVAATFMLFAFIFLAAAYLPAGRIKAALKHPMLISIKIWAIGHLLINGMLAEMILFGAFLIWAVMAFIAARKRDRAEGKVYAAGPMRNDLIAIIVGTGVWTVFITFLHEWLIGVPLFF